MPPIDFTHKKTKILIHIVLWFVLYVIMCFLNHLVLFNVTATDNINLASNFIFLLTVILNHYILIPKIVKSFKNRLWASGILLGSVLYICSMLLANVPLYYLIYLFPNNTLYKATFEFYGIQTWGDILHYKPLLWTVTLIFLWNIVASLVKTAYNLFQSQQEKMAVMNERNNMELNFLRMQIQPHFLFNTLNNIYGMVLDNEKAANSVTKLSELLRFSLSGSKKEWISLAEEILFLTNYIDLERIRHRPEKVKVNRTFSATAAEEKRIKPLLLVNFIENAFKHGVYTSVGKSWVDIHLTANDTGIYFYVANSKPAVVTDGHISAQVQQTQEKDRSMGGIGLENVKRRLALEYFEKHSLSIKETAESYIIELNLLF